MSSLTVITEGGYQMLEYLSKNGVNPSRVLMDIRKYSDIAPYLTEEDEILVIIKGLTDFTFSEVYSVLRDIEESKSKVGEVKILSNIPLGEVKTEYVLYEGDLFYGDIEYKNVERKPEEDKGVEQVEKKESKKFTIKSILKKVKPKEEKREEREINEVMRGYVLKYGEYVEPQVLEKEEERVKIEEEEVYKNVIKEVDFFKVEGE